MPVTWSMPTDADGVLALLDHVQRKWHPELAEAGVRVLVLFARSEDGPALKKGGYPAAALVRVLPLKWRVVTGFDALVELDERDWDEFDKDRRAAVIDHELAHLELVEREAEDGRLVLQRDDIGRPKLKLADGDWNGGDGFLEVVKRHGEAALEYENARRAHVLAEGALTESLAEAGP